MVPRVAPVGGPWEVPGLPPGELEQSLVALAHDQHNGIERDRIGNRRSDALAKMLMPARLCGRSRRGELLLERRHSDAKLFDRSLAQGESRGRPVGRLNALAERRPQILDVSA